METRRFIRTDSPGWPPRLSHSSWTMSPRSVLFNLLCVWILLTKYFELVFHFQLCFRPPLHCSHLVGEPVGWTIHPEAKVCLLGKAGWGTFSVLLSQHSGVDSLVTVSPLCTQHALKLLSMLKKLCPPWVNGTKTHRSHVRIEWSLWLLLVELEDEEAHTHTHTRMHHTRTQASHYHTYNAKQTKLKEHNMYIYIYWIIHSKNSAIKKEKILAWTIGDDTRNKTVYHLNWQSSSSDTTIYLSLKNILPIKYWHEKLIQEIKLPAICSHAPMTTIYLSLKNISLTSILTLFCTTACALNSSKQSICTNNDTIYHPKICKGSQ